VRTASGDLNVGTVHEDGKADGRTPWPMQSRNTVAAAKAGTQSRGRDSARRGKSLDARSGGNDDAKSNERTADER
jgi:hypothetical protein